MVGARLKQIEAQLVGLRADVQDLSVLVIQLIKRDNIMATDLTGLTASVSRNTTVIGSALALIQGISAQLAAAGTDPAALAALKSSLDNQDDALAAAVAANTPAAPTTT